MVFTMSVLVMVVLPFIVFKFDVLPSVIPPLVLVVYKLIGDETVVPCIVFVSTKDAVNSPVEALNVKPVFVLIFDDPDAVDENVMYPRVSVVFGVNVIAVAFAIVPVSGA